MLISVAKVARGLTRDVDHPARCGGEKFAVGLPQTDLGAAAKFAERMRSGIERLRIPSPARDDELHVTARFGVASVPAAAADREGLFKAAEEALRRGKEQGDD